MRVLSVLAICFLYAINVGNAKRGFILTSPKVFDAARMGYFTLSVFDVPPGEEITIRLMAKYGVLVEKKVNIIPNQNMGLEMYVPPLRRDIRAELHIFGKFRDGYEINRKENVVIRLKSAHLTLIQTDKPQYKPGQTVRFRVLPLNDDLMPLGKDAKGQVWIEDSNGIRVSQWSNLTFETNMMQLELPISDEPGFGQWSIKSTINDINHQINFRVEKYVLPEFEVKINSPPYVLDTAETYSAEICARYTYGKKVDGFLRARVIAETNEKPYPKVKYAWKISGCHTMIINTEYLSFKDGLQFKSLKVIANVFQDGTDTVVNKTIAIPIVPKEKMFRLTFLNSDGNGDHYKPGIPYSIILQVLKFDDTVAAWVNVEICIDEAECSTVLSDRDGIISITLNTINHDKKVFSIKAKVVDTLNESNSSDQRASTTNFFIKSWYSPTHSYIQIKRIVEELECGKIQNITIYYTATEEDTVQFYYQVLSRGQIMQHGSHLQTFHSKDDMSKYKNSTALPKVEEFVLSLNVTVAMSPIARLLVFYVRENGEIVADSNIFRIQKCLMNKVGLNFSQKQQYPSTEATIHLSASPSSICGIRMVDKSVQSLDENSHFNKDKLFKQLQHEDISLDSKPSELRIRLCRRMLDFDDWASRIEEDHYADSLSAFERAGTVVISDLIFETGGCDSFMIEDNNDRKNRRFPWGKRKQVSVEVFTTKPPELALEPTDEIRSLFPETWLWEMHLIESTGQKTLKRQLPHTLTEWVGEAVCINSKSGLGISEKSSITAFQPFFLSLQLPYSVVRGESVPIKVSVFNYLKECLPASKNCSSVITHLVSPQIIKDCASYVTSSELQRYLLQIKISLGSSKDYNLVSETPTFSLCACSGDSESRSFMVQPVSLGQVNITVYGFSFEADNTFCFNKIVSTLSAKDAVMKQLLVEADGFPMEDVFNYPICSGVTYGSYSSETALLLPENAVDGSARAYVSVSSDLMAETLTGLKHLVKLPVGCGEQNMVLFAPNIFILDYLMATGKLTEDIKEECLNNMRKGYQRELQYRLTEGSYSAFGMSDGKGSLWLTAFVLKSFGQAKRFMDIDEREMLLSKRWILNKQYENGCFEASGSLIHKAMMGGIGEAIQPLGPLTAFVLISLLESGVVPPDHIAIRSGLMCLMPWNGLMASPPNSYVLALYAYAVALSKEIRVAKNYLKWLDDRAIIKDGYKYWNTSSKSKSLSVEIAGYYVLTQLEIYNHYGVQKSWPVVNWIVRQRNSNGGFVSTQDTIVALQALAKYSALGSQISANMNIVLKSNELVSEIKLDEYNRLVVHTSKIPILPAVVQLQAIGKGCALVQFSVRYNVKAVTKNEAFEISINVFHEENSFCTRPRIHICVRYMNNNETSNMVVVAVKMISGFLPRETSLDELKSDPSIQLKRYDVEGNLVNLYFNELTDICKCFSFSIKQAIQVKNVQPATVKVYDYYQPELEVTKNYSIPSSCLSDVRESTHESHALSSFETSFSGKTGRLDCPICTYSFPDNFKDVFCTSDFVLKVTVTSKEGNVVEILQDMSYEQHPQPFKMFAEITRDDNCPCRQLNRNGSTLIIAGTSLRLWNSEQDKFHIHLTRQVRVILSSRQGIKREILKQLRSSCDSDSRFPTN